jgi:hypothetical protein
MLSLLDIKSGGSVLETKKGRWFQVLEDAQVTIEAWRID